MRKVRTFWAVSVLLVLLPIAALAKSRQLTKVVATEPSDSELRSIREKFKRLDGDRENLSKTERKEASQPSAEGSRAVIYRKKGQVLIVDESYFTETSQSTWSFYFEGRSPFFVLVADSLYGSPKISESRYYFKGGKLIRWLDGKKSQSKRGDRFRDQAKSVSELAAAAYQNAVRSPR